MYFLKNLYVGPSIHDPEKVKRNLISGAGQFTIYVICLSPSIPGPGANQLEILHCVNLQQPYYKKYPPYIIGIAEGMIEAVCRIVRFFSEPGVKTVVAAVAVIAALVCFALYAVALLTGTLSPVAAVLLAPIIIALCGFAAKAVLKD